MESKGFLMTSVNASLNFKRNLGGYETISVNVGVTDDVREGEKVNDAFERVYSFVEKKLLQKVAEIEKELKK